MIRSDHSISGYDVAEVSDDQSQSEFRDGVRGGAGSMRYSDATRPDSSHINGVISGRIARDELQRWQPRYRFRQ